MPRHHPTPRSRHVPFSSSASGSSPTLAVHTYAMLDVERASRTGLPEVVWGPGKTPAQIASIMTALKERQPVVMATRIEPAVAQAVLAAVPEMSYDAEARVCMLGNVADVPRVPGMVAVLTAGTADLSVAAECVKTLQALGASCFLRADVGVAGLHRILAALDHVRTADVVIVVAGMDGALPSVVAGLIEAPVVAVPTSVGYGAAFAGVAPLLSALNSCASGVVVVNIDNGFGAAVAAVKMLRVAERLREKLHVREGCSNVGGEGMAR